MSIFQKQLAIQALLERVNWAKEFRNRSLQRRGGNITDYTLMIGHQQVLSLGNSVMTQGKLAPLKRRLIKAPHSLLPNSPNIQWEHTTPWGIQLLSHTRLRLDTALPRIQLQILQRFQLPTLMIRIQKRRAKGHLGRDTTHIATPTLIQILLNLTIVSTDILRCSRSQIFKTWTSNFKVRIQHQARWSCKWRKICHKARTRARFRQLLRRIPLTQAKVVATRL